MRPRKDLFICGDVAVKLTHDMDRRTHLRATGAVQSEVKINLSAITGNSQSLRAINMVFQLRLMMRSFLAFPSSAAYKTSRHQLLPLHHIRS